MYSLIQSGKSLDPEYVIKKYFQIGLQVIT